MGRQYQMVTGLVAMAMSGCMSTSAKDVSQASSGSALVERYAAANTAPVVDVRTVICRPDSSASCANGPAAFNILVLSGGGAYGAYSAGVLAGWSEMGTRPQFDVITGVSTGALVATLAYLGPERDRDLERLYTRVTDKEVFERRSSLAAYLSDALADSRPLAKLIESSVDADLLKQVAAVHATGRRLYVGTTHLDARRLVVWDMGAIAARGRPDDLALFRKVLLASASVPGLFPPVAIPVEVDGRKTEEWHVDGGVTASMFFCPPQVARERLAALGDRPLAGSNLYVIVAGKLYSDREAVRPRLLDIVSSSVSALVYAQTRGDLNQLFAVAAATGMNYRQAAVPATLPIPASATSFDPIAMRRLYEAGRRGAWQPDLWRITPPGTVAGEDVLIRTGVRLSEPASVISADSAVRLIPLPKVIHTSDN